MSSLKKIRLFENETVAQGQPRRSATEVQKPAVTVQDIDVLRMIEYDMFQFIFGTEYLPEGQGGQGVNYLYRTKNLQIQERYSLHTHLFYIDKAVDKNLQLKKIVTFGMDYQFNEQFIPIDQALVLKIWNVESLIAQQYKYDNSLTGGTIWSQSYSEQLQSASPKGDDERQPFQVPILEKGKPINDDVLSVRFSKDAALAAVVLKSKKNGDVSVYLYRLFDKAGNLVPEKNVTKPLRTFKVEEAKRMGNVIDLFIFKQVINDEVQYNMYLLLEKGILYYPAIEKRVELIIRMDETSSSNGTFLKSGCNDFNYSTNMLVVNVCKRDGTKEEHQIRTYSLQASSMMEYPLENDKKYVRFFKNLILSVDYKPKRPGASDVGEEANSQLQIYDFANGITSYWTTSHSRIMQVEIEDDAVYYLAANANNQVVYCKLYEMEDNVKIHTLMKKSLFMEAKKIANDARFPADIIAEICKEHADKLYSQKNYEEAILQYKDTIGHLNPSYVIQRFIQVPQLDNLITYLEKLTENPDKQQSQLNAVNDYNKDYTALLLNCYVKKEKFDKIKSYIYTSTQEATKHLRIFDVATAIDVCREHKNTRDLAITLATQQKEWSLLVQIYIDDQDKFIEALNIIENEIKNIRDKVDILKVYGPKILKNSVSQAQLRSRLIQSNTTSQQSDRLMILVKSITEDVISLANGSKDKAKLGYGPGQQPVKIEEILQIFVDHPEQLRQFLEFIIQNYGEKVDFKQRGLTEINLHHRLLECYLYKNQSLDTDLSSKDSSQIIDEKETIKKSITTFLQKNDGNGKIDKNYVLFLFQIYQYNEGVKDCCKSLNLRQELLTFYIHHNETSEVFEWCKNPGIVRQQSSQTDEKKERTQQDADLWIQALTYFRDLEGQDSIRDQYLKRSLDHIGENNILSPLLVLEIMAVRTEIKFDVLSPFLIKKLKDQQRVIKSNQEGELNKKGEVDRSGVKQMTERIDAMHEDILRMKRTSKNFDQKNCSQCDQELKLPTVHFICGHTFHEYCADGDHIKRCNIHAAGFDEKVRRKEQYTLQAHDALKFNQELWKKEQKFDTIASYFGQGLFADLQDQLESSELIDKI